MCGGTFRASAARQRGLGLSPRVRGNLSNSDATKLAGGSIPACAGEPPPSSMPIKPVKVYPRVCGGTAPHWAAGRRLMGLSPRVRGNRHRYGIQVIGKRSIPACAGEPARRGPAPGPHRVYPRVCGGTSAVSSSTTARKGLSPRVRGNQDMAGAPWYCQWSIPACAGEPTSRRRASSQYSVYPRVCGGTAGGCSRSHASQGLSPRVRGNLLWGIVVLLVKGSIPACAGEPAATFAPRGRLLVYPRVCGGTAWPGRRR